MTLEKIRAALPTHIMLTPGMHRWREGDTWHETGMTWRIEKANRDIGKRVNIPYAARPIPPHILDNQAFYLWAGQYGGVVPTWENDADVRKHIEKGRLYDKWLLEQMEDV